jgi:hypothetical protein
MKLTRGDLSPCGTMRFWQYQTYVKRDGTRAEHWVPKQSFERKKAHTVQLQELSGAMREWHQMRRAA